MFSDSIDKEIEDIFDEAQQGYNLIGEKYGYEPNTATVSSTVKTLGELFCEYYLCCSEEIHSLEEFLQKEKMDKFITADQYQKLICGDAYLPSDALEYFRLKLPFEITNQKLHSLNTSVRIQNKSAEQLKLNMGELLDETSQMRKEKIEDRERRYHEYDVRYAIIHRDEIRRKHKEKYHTDEEYHRRVRAASKKRYDSLSPEKREEMYQQQRDKYANDPEFRKYVHQKNVRRRLEEKKRMAEDPEYAAAVRQKRRDAKRALRLKKKLANSENSKVVTTLISNARE